MVLQSCSLNMMKDNESGLTLVECLVSMVLLAIVMVGGMHFYFNSTKLVGLSSHKKFATYVANAHMEAIRRKGYSNGSLPASGSSAACSTVNPEIADKIGDLNATCTVTVDPSGAASGYKQIEVKVNWRNPGESVDRLIQFNTFMAP